MSKEDQYFAAGCPVCVVVDKQLSKRLTETEIHSIKN